MAKTLTVYLAADLKKFNGGMRDAERRVNGFGGTLKDNLGPALAAAAVAAGAFAIKLGVDGVKAAAEDQKAVAALATTLDNLNLAHSTEAVEAYIYELERAYGVADTELRPAYDRLVRSTKDIEEANRALSIAMDISAATGKSLETVTDALGRAYDGNTVSLGRLGLGIDRTELAAMSLDQIMSTLARTFDGQADTAAQTFEGQLKRLTTATDNLKEAFGAGLLEALGDTEEGTQDFVETMENLEPLLKDVGAAIGTFGADIAYTAGLLTDLTDNLDGATDGLGFFGDALDSALGKLFTSPLSQFTGAVRALRKALGIIDEEQLFPDLIDATRDWTTATEAATEATAGYLAQANRERQERDRQRGILAEVNQEREDEVENIRRSTGATKALTDAQQKLLNKYELAGIAFATSQKELLDQIAVLDEATRAVEDYATTIQQDLLAGFDLGQLAEGNLDEQGQLNAESFFAGFDKAINQAAWFGSLLNELKSRNVDQRLIEDIAGLGPEVGGALADNLVNGDGALLQTFQEKWQTLQDTTKNLALGLVPEFLLAGERSASEYLTALAGRFGEDQRSFKKLGNVLGRQVGQEFKARTLKEIADAVKQVEALATSARAEAVARAEREQARITEQAVASAIANLIRNSDQRTGRNVEPVLQ